jgi:hypothetical protein
MFFGHNPRRPGLLSADLDSPPSMAVTPVGHSMCFKHNYGKLAAIGPSLFANGLSRSGTAAAAAVRTREVAA